MIAAASSRRAGHEQSSAGTLRALPLRASVLLILVFALVSCGESARDQLVQEHQRVNDKIVALGEMLDRGEIRNTSMIRYYADAVARKKPDLAALTGELSKEARREGFAYKHLATRLNQVELNPSNDVAMDHAFEEVARLDAASDPDVFNDSLVDIINVLADLSEGELARLNYDPTAERRKEGAGVYLVGNPAYGRWERHSSGSSFWAFYGQYALMRHLIFRPGPYAYGTWYGSRPWTYYGGVGRNYYGTAEDTRRWRNASKTHRSAANPKAYGSLRSSSRLSTYGRSDTRAPGSSLKRHSSYSAGSRGTGQAAGGTRGK